MDLLYSVVQQANDAAAALGFEPIDFNPAHSPYVQGMMNPQPATTTTAAPGAGYDTGEGFAMNKPLIMGFTPVEIGLTGLALFAIVKLTKKR